MIPYLLSTTLLKVHHHECFLSNCFFAYDQDDVTQKSKTPELSSKRPSSESPPARPVPKKVNRQKFVISPHPHFGSLVTKLPIHFLPQPSPPIPLLKLYEKNPPGKKKEIKSGGIKPPDFRSA
jgi:hypothetical protein